MALRISRFIAGIVKSVLLVGAVQLVLASAPRQPAAMDDIQGSVDPIELKADHRTVLGLYLTAREANRYLKEHPEILFIDARSRAEVNFLGMPKRADANIPYGFLHPGYRLGDDGKFYNRLKNEHFADAVKEIIARKGLDGDPVIFVICRAGFGAARVVDELAAQGFTRVYSIVDGFEGDLDANGKRSINGWKNAGLPWSYGIGRERAFQPPLEAIDPDAKAAPGTHR